MAKNKKSRERQDKDNAYMRETRAWRKKNHYCIECGEKDAYTLNGRARCADCCEKRGEYNNLWSAEHRERLRERHRNEYAYRKENRLCVKCGKPLGDDKHSSCAGCRAKDAEKHRRYRGTDMRGVGGFCAQCGHELAMEGKKLCQACYDRSCRNLEIGRANASRQEHPWRRDEALRYMSMGR